MKIVRIMLLAMFVSAMGCLVSCKEETPADKIGATTSALEKEAETAKEDAKDAADKATK